MPGSKRAVSAAAAMAALMVFSQALFAPAAQASLFSKAKNALHKLGEQAHDAGVSLGKEVSKTGDTVTQEIVKNGGVIGHAVIKSGRIVQETTIQAGKELAAEDVSGGKFIVKEGKIVGRDVEIDGKIVGAEIIKDGTVIGHTAAKDADYVVEAGELVLAQPKPIPMPGDFPPPAAAKTAAQRLADCQGAKEPDCYAVHQMPTEAGIPKNCLYGWSVGAGHPSSNANPPDYDKQLNALDQCAWFHDRGAWQYNRNTRVCEKYEMCSNSMGLSRCVDRVQPKTPAEAAAKACFTKYFQKAMDACVPALYQDWGAEFAADAQGEQWLSAKSISELRGAMKRCPSVMHHPGFAGL